MRLFFAVICGGIIGLERELKNKSAGIKTNILICFGSALYTSISMLLATSLGDDAAKAGDPSRIAAQIVTGIGFIGGGTIIQTRGTILGLTTAATIWVVAAIGICIGAGYWDVGLACSIAVVLVLVLTNLFEDRILGRSLSFACEITAEDPEGAVRLQINKALANNNLNLDDFDIDESRGQSQLVCRYSGHRDDHKKFVLELWGTPGIKEVRQL
ncbi:MAG: MgtC/SapB family protein [Oligoflexia bacterium]|nr:MgtC/SapB family protein [Oligoflexia bacterium]